MMIDYNDLPPAITDSKDIIQRIKERRSTEDDRSALINGHLQMVVAIAKKVARRNVSDDVIDSGVLGLINAVDTLINKKYETIDENYVKFLNKNISRRCQD